MLKSKLFICLILLSTSWAVAQTPDSLGVQHNPIIKIEQKVYDMEQCHATFDAKLKELETKVASLTAENKFFVLALQQKQQSIDSLTKMVVRNSLNIQATADSLGIRIQTTDKAVLHNSDSLKSKTKWGIGAFVLALLASVVVWLLYKKGQKTSDDKITSLKRQADELNEKIVNQFSGEMSKLQKIGEAMENVGGTSNSEPDHSLVKTLADRITFMEMTLYKMDSSVRGHRQLSRSIAQMKDNLLANGYEIVDMLGKEYNEGMKVTANFSDDENIEEGKQIITGIVKPQINYKGVMIQSAQITVSQNI